VKAVVITRHGGPEVLEIRDVPDPVAGAGEVLVRVCASALNRADLLQRRGLYPAPPGDPPDIPGLEFAGDVEFVGPGVASLVPGDRVMGILGGGGHAEKVAIHERLCLRVPPRMTIEAAGAVPEAFLTAYDALVTRGGLRAGQTVLIQAAASGVGTAAASIARVSGARVLGTSRSRDKRVRLERSFVDRAFDPEDDGLVDAIRLATNGEGVDLIVDLVGRASWPIDLEVLAPRGRLVLVGTLSGARVEADLGLLMRKRLTVVGTVLRSRLPEEKMTVVRAFARSILPLLAEGRLAPVVDRVVPARDVASAHAAMERNESFGKIVLVF